MYRGMRRMSLLAVVASLLACGGSNSGGGAGTYSSSDLTGTWMMNAIASGPDAPWWERAHAVVEADGTFSAATTYSNEPSDSMAGTWALSSGGILTLPGGGDAFQGALDASKTVIVGTGTWDSGSPGTTEMKVMVKLR